MSTLDIMDILQEEIVKIYNIKEQVIGKFKIDSRKIRKNDVFIAIKGNKYNGHDYIDEAMKLKASLIIVSDNIEVSSKCNTMIIRVRDTIKSMGLLAKALLEQIHVPVIAVTGSNGKTTTKNLITSLLSTKYKVLKNEGNLNNHIGLPLTILNYEDEDVIVLEMGMNHFKEIDYLTRICHPNIGVITNIGTAHIGNLGSKKNILKAKLEILNGMKNGFLVINNDDKLLTKIKKSHNQVMRCGSNKNNDLQLLNIKYYLNKTQCIVRSKKEKYMLTINIPGKYIVYDVLVAMQVALIMGITKEDIVETIANYKAEIDRTNLIITNECKIINDCYNASYESLDNILSILETSSDQKILILGDILELGKHQRKILNKLVKRLNRIDNRQVFFMGEKMAKIYKKVKGSYYFTDFKSLYSHLDNISLSDKIILIKASHAMHFEKIYQHLINIDKLEIIG